MFCRTELKFAGQKRYSSRRRFLNRFESSICNNTYFHLLWVEEEMKTKSLRAVSNVSLYLSFVSLIAIILSNQGHGQWQYIMVSLVQPYLIHSFRPFRVRSKYLKEIVEVKACVNFLNVTMDICYDLFFYFVKHYKSIKNNLENKNCSYET